VKQEGGYGLRWFTPKAEVNLCGHATLATAHVLFRHLAYDKKTISFSTHSGELSVTQKGEGRYAMDFPTSELTKEKVPEPLKRGMGNLHIKECFKADDYMLVANDGAAVAALAPDFTLLAEVDTRGVIVTAPGEEVDFVSRFFAPAVGINEDPVTGSAHTMLAPYWGMRLDKKELRARQVSARGGELNCKVLDNGRVEISGQACTFMIGEINFPEIQ
jgi:PhzF family phenazine biosynthesis protein